MTLSRTELLSLFHETASEITEKDFRAITESTVISELGIDSLGMLEIVGVLERRLKMQIPDESLAGIETVKDLIELIERRGSRFRHLDEPHHESSMRERQDAMVVAIPLPVTTNIVDVTSGDPAPVEGISMEK